MVDVEGCDCWVTGTNLGGLGVALDGRMEEVEEGRGGREVGTRR